MTGRSGHGAGMPLQLEGHPLCNEALGLHRAEESATAHGRKVSSPETGELHGEDYPAESVMARLYCDVFGQNKDSNAETTRGK